ncbi:MAG: hypothetical protein AAF958_10580 [Planctomycetota bacterium]
MIRHLLPRILSSFVFCVLIAFVLPIDRFAFCQDGRSEDPAEADTPLIKRHEHAVRRDQCFPIKTLSTTSRKLSKQMLLNALDSEALFTFVGDLKPVSEGFQYLV